MKISDAITALIEAARIAHRAPDAPATDFRFSLRADGQGIDAFRGFAGVTLPIEPDEKAGAA